MRRVCIVAVILLGVVTPSSASGPVSGGPRTQLAHYRALWEAQRLRDYSFRLRLVCFCPEGVRSGVRITVRGGRPRGATGFQRRLDTVPELFARIREALDDPRAGPVTVAYDGRRGFPRSASIDRLQTAIDDEYGWTVDRFRVLRPRR